MKLASPLLVCLSCVLGLALGCGADAPPEPTGSQSPASAEAPSAPAATEPAAPTPAAPAPGQAPSLDPAQQQAMAQIAARALAQAAEEAGAQGGADPAAPSQPSTPRLAVDPNGEGLQAIAQVGQALEGALDQAARAEGSDDCERGYNGLVAMVGALQQQLDAMGGGQRQPLPDQGAFLSACRELPTEVQRCLVVSYALEHRAECEAAKNQLDPEVRARIQRLMAGQP